MRLPVDGGMRLRLKACGPFRHLVGPGMGSRVEMGKDG